MQVFVRDNNVDQALRALKKKLQREGVFREMKLRKHYEKPSERKVREKAEAVRRARKLARKKLQREGLLPPTKPRVERTAGEGRVRRGFLVLGLDARLAKKLLNPAYGEVPSLIVHG
jgi:small subunit ribosomal protein S21